MAGGWEARVSLLDSGFAGLGRCGGGGDLKCGGEGIGGGGYATTGAGETAAAAAAAGFNLGRRSWRGPLTEIGEEVELGLDWVSSLPDRLFSPFTTSLPFFSLLLPLD